MRRLVAGRNLGAVQRRESRRQSLARRLMAGGAIGGVDSLAPRLQVRQRPHLVRILGRGGRLLLLFGHPLGVFFRRHDLHHDRHEAVVLAAQLGALAAVGAFLVGAEPGVAHETRNGVLLDAEGRHPERVDHVIGGRQHAHFLAHRHHQRIIHFEQIVLVLGLLVVDLVLRRSQGGQEADALAFALEVVVAPFPLVAGGLDRNVGVGRVLEIDHGLGRGPGHADEDQERDYGPDDFHGGVLVELRGLVANGLAVGVNGVEHHAEDDAEDHQDDVHHQHVQIVDFARDPGHGRLKIDSVGGRCQPGVERQQ